MDDSMMWLAVIGGWLIFGLLALIVGYIISSIAISKSLKLLGYPSPGLGWVPIYRDVLLWDVTRLVGIRPFGISIPMNILRFTPLISLVAVLISLIPFLGSIVSRLLLLMTYFFTYQQWKFVFAIFENKEPNRFSWMSLFNLFLGGFVSFFMSILTKPSQIGFDGIQRYNYGSSGMGYASYTENNFGSNYQVNQQSFNQGYQQNQFGQQMYGQPGFQGQGFVQQQQGYQQSQQQDTNSYQGFTQQNQGYLQQSYSQNQQFHGSSQGFSPNQGFAQSQQPMQGQSQGFNSNQGFTQDQQLQGFTPNQGFTQNNVQSESDEFDFL